MRRYRTVSRYLEAFESAAQKLNSPEILEKAERQIVFEDSGDEQEYAEMDEEYEEEQTYYERPKSIIEQPTPEESIQLTFF